MEQPPLKLRPASLTIICPMKNEAGNLAAFFARLVPVLESVADTYEILCINDGSSDDTLPQLLLARERNPHIRIADLSRNFGKEAALTCGIELARGDVVIPMDADPVSYTHLTLPTIYSV